MAATMGPSTSLQDGHASIYPRPCLPIRASVWFVKVQVAAMPSDARERVPVCLFAKVQVGVNPISFGPSHVRCTPHGAYV